MLKDLVGVTKLFTQFPELKPDLKYLVLTTKLRQDLKANDEIYDWKKKEIAETFLEFDLTEPFSCEENAQLAREILELEKISSVANVKKIEFLLNLTKNNIYNLIN